MPVNLNKPAEQVKTTESEYVTMLRNLQANIIWSHGRSNTRHLFLRFTGSAPAVRAWIRNTVAPTVTRASEQQEQRLQREANKDFDGGMVRGFFLSALGYTYLGHEIGGFKSSAFRKGMKKQSTGLVSSLIGAGKFDPAPSTWQQEYQGAIHALITLADSAEAPLDQAVAALRISVAGIAEILTVEEGAGLWRRDEEQKPTNIEHFGYVDGISQPIFTSDELSKVPSNNHWNAGAPLSLILTGDPLVNLTDAFGSYFVFRKLGQQVDVFEQRVLATAAATGNSPQLTGAMAVGRFRDGSPVLLTDSPAPGIVIHNDFNFHADESGERCPFHAHIRKVNPRGTTPLTSDEKERERRIARRGIPYGKPMPGVADPSIETDPDPKAPRGLLFMCFQRSIENQFEFIQRTWVDNSRFPTAILPIINIFQKKTGDDPVIGQAPGKPQRWPAWGNHAAGKKEFNFESAVTLEGGEYFFAPSVPFLFAQ